MKAFTLLELLITLIIFAIVVAMLFPIFATARDYSGPGCQGHLRGLGYATLQYRADYDDTLPPTDSLPLFKKTLMVYDKGERDFYCQKLRQPLLPNVNLDRLSARWIVNEAETQFVRDFEHSSKEWQNFLFVDGHVKRLPSPPPPPILRLTPFLFESKQTEWGNELLKFWLHPFE